MEYPYKECDSKITVLAVTGAGIRGAFLFGHYLAATLPNPSRPRTLAQAQLFSYYDYLRLACVESVLAFERPASQNWLEFWELLSRPYLGSPVLETKIRVDQPELGQLPMI